MTETDPRPADPTGDAVGPWLLTLAPHVLDLVRAYLPGAPIDARRRELLATVTATAAGCRPLALLHAGWHDVLGPADLHELDDEVLAWAVAAVAGGPGLSADRLPAELSIEARRAVSAVVAHTAASAAAAGALGAVADRVRRRATGRAGSLVGQLASGLAALPLVAPTAAAGIVVAAVGRLVPGTPPVLVDEEPNLLAQLLAETVPVRLGGPGGRTLIAALPVAVPIAIRTGLTGATLRLGAGRIQVENGIAADAWAIVDGEVDGLLQAGTQHLSRELRAARLPR